MMSLFGAGIPHFILEVVILLCPLIEIWRLHLATAKKLAVAAMFTSGVFVCCSALGTIIHTVALDKKVDKDLTWDGIDDQIWAVCDVNLASFASKFLLHRYHRNCLADYSQHHYHFSAQSSAHSVAYSAVSNPPSHPRLAMVPRKQRLRMAVAPADAHGTARIASQIQSSDSQTRATT
jgi:hypothetical protein